MGDWDYGVTLRIRENGEQRGLGSREQSSVVCLLRDNCPEPLFRPPSHSSPQCRVLQPLRCLPTSNMAARASVEGWAETAVLATVALLGLYPAQKSHLPVFRLSARRRQRCNFLRSSRIRVHPTPAASTMPPKFDPSEITVVYPRCTGGEVGATSALAPKIGPLGLSTKKVGDDIAKATGDWKGLRITMKLTRTDKPRLRWYLLLLP